LQKSLVLRAIYAIQTQRGKDSFARNFFLTKESCFYLILYRPYETVKNDDLRVSVAASAAALFGIRTPGLRLGLHAVAASRLKTKTTSAA